METAIQEDVNIIGYRIMHGSPKVLIATLFENMKGREEKDTPVVVSGIVPERDEALVKGLGVEEVLHFLGCGNTLSTA